MIVQPAGFLRGVRELATKYDVLLIADEVAAGFGRTGQDVRLRARRRSAGPDVRRQGHHRRLPAAGGDVRDAADLRRVPRRAVGGQDLLSRPHVHRKPARAAPRRSRRSTCSRRTIWSQQSQRKAQQLAEMLEPLRDLPHVGDVRQKGFMVGIELVADKATREPFDPKRRVGAEVCMRIRQHGVILRPLGDVIVLMPPLAMGLEDLQPSWRAVDARCDSFARSLRCRPCQIRDWDTSWTSPPTPRTSAGGARSRTSTRASPSI